MYKYKFQICELAHAQIEEKRGVPTGICRSCIHDPKVVARNTKIDQQIYLLTAGKGLSERHLSRWKALFSHIGYQFKFPVCVVLARISHLTIY